MILCGREREILDLLPDPLADAQRQVRAHAGQGLVEGEREIGLEVASGRRPRLVLPATLAEQIAEAVKAGPAAPAVLWAAGRPDTVLLACSLAALLLLDRWCDEPGAARAAAFTAVALVGIGAVLSAVFVPMAFFPGTAGAIYRQFSITIVLSLPVTECWMATWRRSGSRPK